MRKLGGRAAEKDMRKLNCWRKTARTRFHYLMINTAICDIRSNQNLFSLREWHRYTEPVAVWVDCLEIVSKCGSLWDIWNIFCHIKNVMTGGGFHLCFDGPLR